VTNPLLEPSAAPFAAPDFPAIAVEDFPGAFAEAMRREREEVVAIAANAEPPTIANTLDALELAGQDLERVGAIFWNLAGTDSTEAIRAIERDISPKLAAHRQAINADPALFRRIDALFQAADRLGLDDEQRQALAKIRRRCVKAGAELDDAGREQAAAIKQRLASLGTAFGQNVLKDETDWTLVLGEDDLAGLPPFLVSAAKAEAESRGKDGYVITLLRSSVEPFLVFSERRDLRERAFRAWASRGDKGETDNKPIVAETLRLRAAFARLLGYPDYASFKLSDSMAKTAANAQRLLDEVWAAGKRRAEREHDELAAIARADGLDRIEPWDWRFYAERLRLKKHALDEAAIKPYFQLDNMIAAAFDCANRLFGITCTPAPDAPLYHPDVRAWEVKDSAGRRLALFYGDYYARPGKHSGAWMSGFRGQRKLGGEVRPIVLNVMNFSKPAPGRPALLSFDDAHTLFHEFGHALHGMLSDVTYPSLSGTNVPRDFVELPSQLFEHWLDEPEVLARHALHAETGEPISQALLDKLTATRTFNQGFLTVEYCASALVDLAFHTLPDPDALDVAAFEAEVLARLGLPAGTAMRHRTPHFTHVFSGEGYSAGYYSYLWSETLDADAFRAFKERGDIFDPETARALARHIYAAGDRRDPARAYELFRGRLPTTEALIEKRGLKEAA
jgi:peptidyl-dipeptidase Dcp